VTQDDANAQAGERAHHPGDHFELEVVAAVNVFEE
jgi:hypothetical protein